ncbi:hypothetical protein POTOM_030196 [Populus tomentosa]|uniref:N-acetyltransferase domain-containing protein n=1 Tax=Populus tomentosa TaxID=118781 RepID=A0A8X8CUP7_POPTO|nr:hypothetical protein POTOM_030196 [Populus tomentosa]
MPSSIPAEETENDISSEVITLRPYKESDADDFLGYAGDDEVTRFTRWNTFSCKEEALVYIKDFCIPHPYCRSICVNDRSIGFVFIRQESGDDKCRAELGYAIAAKYWGQGVTTRALKMAISDGLRSFPDLVRLQARVDVENKASQRVLEKLGFLKEGVLRKYMYLKARLLACILNIFLNLSKSSLLLAVFMDSSRISLRPFKLSDVDDFLKWASDDRVTRYLRWNSITSREEALAHLEKVAIPHPWRRSICLDDRSIGYISISPESNDDRCRASFGYALAAEYWGQGIATIASKMAVSSVFQDLPYLVRLQALVEVENRSSQRVLEKTGFVKEGLLRKYGYCKGEIRDMLVYSFLSTDLVL